MPTEQHYFQIEDPLINAILITIKDDYALIDYYFVLPTLEPTETEYGRPPLFTAAHNENFLSLDLQKRHLRVMYRVDPSTAIKAIQNYSKIAIKHTITTD